jgi:hypothetical protein
MTSQPSPTDDNGRHPNGRFGPGNRFASGNPHARKVAALRTALMNAVTEEDLQKIVAALVEAAKGGDIHAAREILDRVLGKPTQTDLLQRVEALEILLADRYQHVN